MVKAYFAKKNSEIIKHVKAIWIFLFLDNKYFKIVEHNKDTFGSNTEQLVQEALQKDKKIIDEAKNIRNDVQKFLCLLKNMDKPDNNPTEESEEKFIFITEEDNANNDSINVSEFAMTERAAEGKKMIFFG
jgi:hypothetical protein